METCNFEYKKLWDQKTYTSGSYPWSDFETCRAAFLNDYPTATITVCHTPDGDVGPNGLPVE